MSGGYRVIYADPPWSFATYSARGKARSADRHYSTMGLEAIKALPVAAAAATDSVLLLWTTDPHLEAALEVVGAWGFAFKTVGFYWIKTGADGAPSRGMGYWTRANPEACLLGVRGAVGLELAHDPEAADLCLLGTRGAPGRRGRGVDRLVIARRGAHSAKPIEVYRRIEELLEGPYLELFARATWPGWDAWGDQVAARGGVVHGGVADLEGLPAAVAEADQGWLI